MALRRICDAHGEKCMAELKSYEGLVRQVDWNSTEAKTPSVIGVPLAIFYWDCCDDALPVVIGELKKRSMRRRHRKAVAEAEPEAGA